MIIEWVALVLWRLYNWRMKSRHKKNKSLVNEHSRSNPYAHHRSFSYNRYPLPLKVAYPPPPPPTFDPLVSDSITLPMSTQYNRQGRNGRKPSSKQGSQQLPKQKKTIKSRDKQSNPRKPKQKSKPTREKPSNERGDKSDRKGSKEMLRNKHNQDRLRADYSGEHKGKYSEEKKIQNGDKAKAEKAKPKTNGKRKHCQDDAANWEEIIHNYADRLTPEEEVEIREYKWVYFLGKIKERKPRELQVLSARDRRREEKEFFLDNNQYPLLNQKRDSYEYNVQRYRQFYHYELGDHLAYRYQIIQSINKGSFGQVLKVRDHKTGQEVAVKVVKRSPDIVQQTYIEVAILTHIKEKDRSDVNSIVRIKDFTIFRSHICIVFELLEGNLYELLEYNHYNGLSQQVIRIFAVQILSALAFLQQERIIHCDIKPENIVMRSWGKSRVKLIDFGSSCFAGQQVFEYLQSRYYRAPEVMLRRPYSYQIDMWSFGCLLLELRIGQPVFAGATNTQQLLYIANSIGMPDPTHGKYSREFLESEEFKEIIQENYLEEYHYMEEKGIDPRSNPFFAECKYLKNCMRTIKERVEGSHGPRQDSAFLKFIQRILVWEPERRLRPQEALQDHWILKGLPTEIKEFYTIFNTSGELKSKSKSKQKDSKSKSKSKHGSDKPRKDASSGKVKDLRPKQSNQVKVHFNHKALTSHIPLK